MDKFYILKTFNIIDSIIRDLELELRFSKDDIFKKQCIDIIAELHCLKLKFSLLKLEE